MSVPNRSALINKMFSVLKRHFTPVAPPADRPLLEHLLYACCLENARHEAADEAFARLQQSFYDWNEIRVTTVTELAETMASLPDPSAAASRLKRCLQSVFETHYAFDIEHLRKMNLGKALKELQKINGATPFVVSYVLQAGLGGHSIPTSQGVLDAMEVVGVITPAEAKQHRVPGLERAIPKAKGIDFASLLHQLGADFFASPFGSKVRSVLLEISPEAKDRWPKRSTKTTPADAPASPAKTGRKRAGSTGRRAEKDRPADATGAQPKRKRASRSHAAQAEDKNTGSAKKKQRSSADGAKNSPSKRLSQRKPR